MDACDYRHGWQAGKGAVVARSEFSHWYSDRKWRKKRADFIAANPLCVFCQKAGRVEPATIADHVDAHRGDRVKFWNGELQALCGTCHS